MNNPFCKRNRVIRLLITTFFGCCVALVLSSCSKKPGAAIIGKWRAQATEEIVEFRKDGTVITTKDITAGPPGNTRTQQDETTGKYTFTDGSHMDLQINEGDTNRPALSVSCEVQIHGDTMELGVSMPGQKELHKTMFKRLK